MQLSGPVLKSLQAKLPVERLLPSFRIQSGRLIDIEMACVPRKFVSDVLKIKHCCCIYENFSHSQTLSSLNRFYWKRKHCEVKSHFNGCHVFQKQNDGRYKPLGVTRPLELPTRRWGYICTEFITHMPKTSRELHVLKTFVDRFSKRANLSASSGSDLAVDVTNTFFREIFRHHGPPD